MSNKTKPCIFCKIVQGETKDTVIVWESTNVIVFKDIRPASDFHYLAIPKAHLDNIKALSVDDIPLLNEMKDGLLKTFEKDGIDINDASFGFHWPPFNSIAHLHLHGIAPINKMSFLSRQIFKPNNMWYCTFEYVVDRINRIPNDLK